MDSATGKNRQFPAVTVAVVLILLCIYPGQLLTTQWFPAASGFVQVNPSLIFLDIPIPLPVTIDLLLVMGLFLILYPLVIVFYPSQSGIPSWQQAIQRVQHVVVGFMALLCCMLLGGFIYYLVQDHLSEDVRNGINSLGINADIHLSYFGFDTIHLRGSLILLVCFIIGITICIFKIKKEPGKQKAGRLTREQRMTPYKRMMQEKRVLQKPTAKQDTHTTTVKNNARETGKKWQSAHPDGLTAQHNRKVHQHICYNQPVSSLKPVAVAYMPLV